MRGISDGFLNLRRQNRILPTLNSTDVLIINEQIMQAVDLSDDLIVRSNDADFKRSAKLILFLD